MLFIFFHFLIYSLNIFWFRFTFILPPFWDLNISTAVNSFLNNFDVSWCHSFLYTTHSWIIFFISRERYSDSILAYFCSGNFFFVGLMEIGWFLTLMKVFVAKKHISSQKSIFHKKSNLIIWWFFLEKVRPKKSGFVDSNFIWICIAVEPLDWDVFRVYFESILPIVWPIYFYCRKFYTRKQKESEFCFSISVFQSNETIKCRNFELWMSSMAGKLLNFEKW